MLYLEHTLPTLHANLALDEALLLAAEQGGPEVLRIWEWPTPAIVLGAACRLTHDVNEAACRDAGIPIARRSSGGGTVLLGAGCLLYSLVLRYETAPELGDVRASYRWILERIHTGLQTNSAIELAGISDLACGGHKFSGNAQQRKRDHLLHHGSILYAFELALLERYLHPPEREPDYRRGRRHADFVMNFPVERTELIGCLRSVWNASGVLTTIPDALIEKLVAEKYSREDWQRRR